MGAPRLIHRSLGRVHLSTQQHGALKFTIISHTQLDNEVTVIFKFSTTALYTQIVPTDVSVRELKAHLLRVLASTKQPEDQVLHRPFEEATPDDVELYHKQGDTYTLFASASTATHRASDGTPLCSSCQLEDNTVLYVGFRAPNQDTPGEPVVREPSLDDIAEEEDVEAP